MNLIELLEPVVRIIRCGYTAPRCPMARKTCRAMGKRLKGDNGASAESRGTTNTQCQAHFTANFWRGTFTLVGQPHNLSRQTRNFRLRATNKTSKSNPSLSFRLSRTRCLDRVPDTPDSSRNHGRGSQGEGAALQVGAGRGPGTFLPTPGRARRRNMFTDIWASKPPFF